MPEMSLEERKTRAVELRGQGWTYREIAEDVGVSHTAVRSYLAQAGLVPAPPHTAETAHAALTHLMERSSSFGGSAPFPLTRNKGRGD